MTGALAEVGDLVEDGERRPAIVTDIKRRGVWVLRSPAHPMAHQWETDDPHSLRVIERRDVRLARDGSFQ